MSLADFRTWDERLRAARQAVLLDAAAKADAFARSRGATLLVGGSLARGQVHPWSDLDLIALFPEDGARAYSQAVEIMEVSGLKPYDEVTVLTDADLTIDIGKRLRASAIPFAEAPRELSPLPEPELSVERVREALGYLIPSITDKRASAAKYSGDDADLAAWIIRREAERIAHRLVVSLRRLAVFQDAGRSSWLDDDHDLAGLQGLLERLSRPADEPFSRPALIPGPMLACGPSLLCRDGSEDDGIFDQEAVLDAPIAWSELLGPRRVEEEVSVPGPSP